MTARLRAALACACLGLALGGAASATPPVGPGPPASAQGLALGIVAPDQTLAASTTAATAPPAATQDGPRFVYPDDGSIVSADSSYVAVSASAADGTAAAVSEVTGISLFNGEITADRVRGSVSSAGTIGDLSDSVVTNLVVSGSPVQVAPNTKIALGDWGTALLLGQSANQGRSDSPSWSGTVTGLVVHLNADHGGLSAGAEIRIAFAEAYARPPAPPKASTGRTTTTAPSNPAPAPARTPRGSPGGTGNFRATGTYGPRGVGGPFPVVPAPPLVTPKLTANRYVFPVYGPSAYGDTFGAPRSDVAGGWHHGDDIFAPLGAPILAVADGTVFSVGWERIGGYRLWLRDRGGNEFYYAHLSAYTSLAVNGRHVSAGDVLGFIGNTGDAKTTPFHLHFEVHPVSMLYLGYDGAVNPTRYLDAWKRLEDVRILPAVPFSLVTGASTAPPAAVILLQSSDISTANGLDPASLTRVMRALPTVDVTTPPVSQLPVPLPVLDRA